MYRKFLKFLVTDRGGSAAEYALVTGLIGIAVIVGVVYAGDVMGMMFNYIGSELSNAVPLLSKIR